jgi:TLD
MEYKEALLDRCPVSEEELDGLSALFPFMDDLFSRDINIQALISAFRFIGTSSRDTVEDVHDDNTDGNRGNSVETKHAVAAEHNSQTDRLLLWLVPIIKSTVQDTFVVGLWEDDDPVLYRLVQFVEGVATLMGKRSVSSRISTLLFNAVLEAECLDSAGDQDASNTKVSSNKDNEQSTEDFTPQESTQQRTANAQTLARVLLMMLDCVSDDSGDSQPPLLQNVDSSLWAHSMSDSQRITLQEWKDWSDKTVPNMSEMASVIFRQILLPQQVHLPAQPLLHSNSLIRTVSSLSLTSAAHHQLSLLGIGSHWDCLYDSNQHGFSFHALAHSLLGYSGPTVILMHTRSNHILGLYTKVPWKTTNNWYSGDGHEESFLFRLHPYWNVYRMTEGGSSHKYAQYLTVPAHSSRHPHKLCGLAMGGVGDQSPRLHINDTLEDCTASSFDLVYESGPLLSNNDCSPRFDIDSILAWAVTDTAQEYMNHLSAGQRNRAIHEATRQQAARVDRTQFVDDFVNGTIINGLFTHRVQARGRADFVADNDDGMGYYIADKPPSPFRLEYSSFQKNHPNQQ